jgi:hypothetical protein
MARRIAPLAGAALAALAALAVAVPAGAQAPPGAQTLTVTEPGSGGTFNIVDNAPKSRRHGRNLRFSVGDALVISNRVLDGSRKRIGTVRAVCFITKAGGFDRAESDCVGVFALTTGSLYVTVEMNFTATTSTGSVVGGTGAYQGLHGTWTSVQHRDESSTDTFTLTP